MKDKLLQIINYYGVLKQLKYFQSEVFELNEAVINAETFSKIYGEMEEYDLKHIAEEIADVLVMLKQIQLYYEISSEEIKEVAQYKIDRQIERINDDRTSKR